MHYRQATAADIDAMARIRTEGQWRGGATAERMAGYLAGIHHPQHALIPRVIYVAEEGTSLAGFVAGHLTNRFDCAGELQWLYVLPAKRGGGIASHLLRRMAAWFVSQNARRVCVNTEPENRAARQFYGRHGAQELDEHWMVWDDVTIALAQGSPLVPPPAV